MSEEIIINVDEIPVEVVEIKIDEQGNQTALDAAIRSEAALEQIEELISTFNPEGSDNKFKPIYIHFIGEAEEAVFAAAVNAMPIVSVAGDEIPSFIAISDSNNLALPLYYKFQLYHKGKGSYGVGGTMNVVAGDINILYSKPVHLQIIEDQAGTQFFNLGEIGNFAPEAILNDHVPGITIQDQSVGYRVARSTINGKPQNYLFVGPAGKYGDNFEQAAALHFQPLGAIPAMVPTLAEVSVAGGKRIYHPFRDDPAFPDCTIKKRNCGDTIVQLYSPLETAVSNYFLNSGVFAQGDEIEIFISGDSNQSTLTGDENTVIGLNGSYLPGETIQLDQGVIHTLKLIAVYVDENGDLKNIWVSFGSLPPPMATLQTAINNGDQFTFPSGKSFIVRDESILLGTSDLGFKAKDREAGIFSNIDQDLFAGIKFILDDVDGYIYPSIEAAWNDPSYPGKQFIRFMPGPSALGLSRTEWILPFFDGIETFASQRWVLEHANIGGAITQILGGAPDDANTLKEVNDKILALQAIIGSAGPDVDSVVNTVAEVLAVMSNFPEGLNLLTALAAKFDIANLYNALDGIVAGKALDARQGKILKDLVDTKAATLTSANLGTFISNLLAKIAPADGDGLLLSDITSGGAAKYLSLSSLTGYLRPNFEEIFAKNTIPTALTSGTASQVLYYSLKIPANVLKIGSIFTVEFLPYKNGQAGTSTLNVYTGDTATELTFSKIIGSFIRLASNNYQAFSRTFQVVSLTKVRLMQWNLNAANDKNVSVQSYEEKDFYCQSDQFINITGTLSNSADSMAGAYAIIKGIR